MCNLKNGDKDIGQNLHRKLQISVKNSQAWRIFISRMSSKLEFEKLFSELSQKLCEWTYLIPQVKQCMYQSKVWTKIQVFFCKCDKSFFYNDPTSGSVMLLFKEETLGLEKRTRIV